VVDLVEEETYSLFESLFGIVWVLIVKVNVVTCRWPERFLLQPPLPALKLKLVLVIEGIHDRRSSSSEFIGL
jgi:hypothetical protein